MSKAIKLTSTEQGVSIWIDPENIDFLQQFNPADIKESTLILPGKEKDAFTMIYTKHGHKALVTETPEEIFAKGQ